MSLTNNQRGQARKDLIELHAAILKANGNPLVPEYVKDALTAMERVLETLAIDAGVFEVIEG